MFNRTKKALVVLCVVVLALTSCSGAEDETDTVDSGNYVVLVAEFSTQLYRFVDTEAGVVCWLSGVGYGGGIDCMPLSETQLRGE